ncbi:hypothetical protein RJ035_008045, partial [Blastomyces gilchristii]
VDVIRLLLRAGARLDVQDRNGETPVDMAESAMGAGNGGVARVFLEESGIVLEDRGNGSSSGKGGTSGLRASVNGGNAPKYKVMWKPRVIR